MSNKKVLALIAAILALIGINMALSGIPLTKEAGSGGRLGIIKGRGELIVATDATYPPLESIDERGEFFGMDIDIAKEIARDMGVDVKFKNILWDNIFDDLKKGNVDIITSSVTITKERAEQLGFSDPYFNAGQVIVSTSSALKSISGPKDLAGYRLGVQPDTTSSTEAKKYTNPSLVFDYHDYNKAKADLLSGKLDALIIDYPAAVALTKDEQNVQIIGDIFTQEFYGIATQKNQPELIEQINKTIRRLKQAGEIRNLEKKWLGR